MAERYLPEVRTLRESYDIPLNWPAGYKPSDKPPATVGTLEHRVAALEKAAMPSELVADVLKAAVAWKYDLMSDKAASRLLKALVAYEKWATLKGETK